ncbi:MAG: NAD(P)H-hydrate dehydratase [Tissierellia bacterium]|nr:NAD(P)H-hydrate dehydratase [Tissierellia bacterium]
MIIGNGVDIVKISRIENLLIEKKYNFLNKIFTEKEIKYINKRNHSLETISGMFASKEAVSKILGTGVGKVNWKDIEILHDEKGKPYVKLYNEGFNLCRKLGIDRVYLSVSHEKEYAIAFAIGEGKGYINNIMVPKNVKNILPKRKKYSHKGTFGRVGIIAGSTGMTGAPYLSTMAALRTGSGLVYTIIPKSISEILSIKLIEAIIKPVEDNNTGYFTLNSFKEIEEIIKDMDVLAIGPGMGVDEERIEIIKRILLNYKKPVVLDADGINCISMGDPDILSNREGSTIITPHLGELSRLLGISIREIQKKPMEYSKYISNKYNVITVLKGANTIVGNKRGNIYINSTGNPGMATAGSGDVLTGIITSLIGQGVAPYEAAMLGVYCHGLAGDLARIDKGEYGMIGRDILDNIPHSIKILE